RCGLNAHNLIYPDPSGYNLGGKNMLTFSNKGLVGKAMRIVPAFTVVAMVLAACGEAPTATVVPPTAAPPTAMPATAMPATAMPVEATATAPAAAATDTAAPVAAATATKVKGQPSKEGVLTLWVDKNRVPAVNSV